MSRDGYRWVEHTAELELEILGRSERAVFAEALRAFAELAGDVRAGDGRAGAADGRGVGGRGGAQSREILLPGDERAVLLARWLDELEFLAETEDLVPDAIERFTLDADGLRASVRCHRGRPRSVVKGVTYHRLSFTRDHDLFRATVILDV